MSVERRFAEVCDRLLAGGQVESGRMLRATGLKTAGKFFAFATKGELVVKLPAERVRMLIASGEGHACEPHEGHPMREWVCLAPADEQACAGYVLEAREFVEARNTTATAKRDTRD